MKQIEIKRTQSQKGFSRLSAILSSVAVACLLIGLVTGISKSFQPLRSVTQMPQTIPAQGKYVTLTRGGQTVQVDPETGQIARLSTEEAKKFAAGISERVNPSSEGLKATHHRDGSVSVDLQDRFQNVIVVRKDPDGSITQSCVDNVQAAAAFFEIDPALLKTKVNGPSRSPRKQ